MLLAELKLELILKGRIATPRKAIAIFAITFNCSFFFKASHHGVSPHSLTHSRFTHLHDVTKTRELARNITVDLMLYLCHL